MGARAGHRHHHAGLRAPEPLRGLSRAAVPAGLARLRPVAADEVPVGCRADGPPRHPRPQDPPRQARAGLRRRRQPCSTRCAARRSMPPATRRSSPTCARPARRSSTTSGSSSGLSAAALRRVREPLERTGAIVTRSVTVPARTGGHRHTSELRLWPQAETPLPGAGASPERALDDLLVAGVRAAVLAPEDEVARWFSWPVPEGTVESLVAEGRIVRYSSISPALVGSEAARVEVERAQVILEVDVQPLAAGGARLALGDLDELDADPAAGAAAVTSVSSTNAWLPPSHATFTNPTRSPPSRAVPSRGCAARPVRASPSRAGSCSKPSAWSTFSSALENRPRQA